MLPNVQYDEQASERRGEARSAEPRPEGPNRDRAKRAKIPDEKTSEVTDDSLTKHEVQFKARGEARSAESGR